MDEKLTALVEKTGLDEDRKKALLEQFNAFLEQADEFGKVAMAIKVTDIGHDNGVWKNETREIRSREKEII